MATLTTATVRRVSPDARDIKPADRQRIAELLAEKDRVQLELEKAVAKALKNGASIRGVVEGTGLASATVQKYGRAHGWPTAENRAKFYETSWDRYRDRRHDGERS